MTAYATPLLRARLASVPDAPVLTLIGEIDLSSAEELTAALESWDGRVVVDLSGVSFLDCSGIGILVAARNRLLAGGGDLQIRSPRGWVRRVFEILGLDDWITDGTHPPRVDCEPAA